MLHVNSMRVIMAKGRTFSFVSFGESMSLIYQCHQNSKAIELNIIPVDIMGIKKSVKMEKEEYIQILL